MPCCWLVTWNEFLFALILTGNRVPMITVVMAQFVTEMGLRWNLMAATAVMALVPAFLLALFGQKYVIRVCASDGSRRDKTPDKTGRRSYAATDKMVIAATAAWWPGRAPPRASDRTADRLSASPIRTPRCDVRDVGRQNGVKIVQVPNLRRLRRENDGFADVELGSVRRHLAQRRLGTDLGAFAGADR